MAEHFAGLDVSLETTTICVIDDQGGVVFEGSVATDSDAIAGALAPHAPGCVGLEAGPMSEWLHTGLTRASSTRAPRAGCTSSPSTSGCCRFRSPSAISLPQRA